MRSSGRTSLCAASACLLIALALCLPAIAGEQTPARKPAQASAVRGKAAAPLLRDEIAIPLNETMKLIDAKNFLGALVKLADADSALDKTPFEEYTIAKYLGFIFINQPMPDWDAARAAYNRQVASHGCPDWEQPNMYELAMRLIYQFMDDENVIMDGSQLWKLRPLDGTDFLLLATAYFRTGDFANAAATAQAGMNADAVAGKLPDADLRGKLLDVLMNARSELKEK
jgi:hypothetical protein